MANPLNKVYFGTNTKMYKNIRQTVAYLQELETLTANLRDSNLELFVIPSFTALDAANRALSTPWIRLGAQNMGWEEEGPFTGEISPGMLHEVGVQIVEIGHSERRHVLNETDEMENRKVRCALRNGFTALLCIGETETQKSLGLAPEILRIQLKAGLHGISPIPADRLRIAYEPVWAIGASGTPASPEYAGQMHNVIRKCLAELYGEDTARAIPLLYGGSVNERNAVQLLAQPEVDGLFIGRCAWDAARFNGVIRDCLAHLDGVAK